MVAITIEELVSSLETYDAENCVSIRELRDKPCLEVWDRDTGCTIGYIKIPE